MSATELHSPEEPVYAKGWSFSLGPNDPNLAGSPLLTASVLRGTPSASDDSSPKSRKRDLIPSPLSMPNLPEDLRDPETFNPVALAKYLFPGRDRSKRLTPQEFELLNSHPLWANAFKNSVSGRWAQARANWAKSGADENNLEEFFDASRETGLFPVSYDDDDTEHEHPKIDYNSGDLEMTESPNPEWLKKNDLASNVFRRLFPLFLDLGRRKVKDFFSSKPPTFNV